MWRDLTHNARDAAVATGGTVINLTQLLGVGVKSVLEMPDELAARWPAANPSQRRAILVSSPQPYNRYGEPNRPDPNSTQSLQLIEPQLQQLEAQLQDIRRQLRRQANNQSRGR